MLDLKSDRRESSNRLVARPLSRPRITQIERSIEAGAATRRLAAAGETSTRSPYVCDGDSPASATSGLGPADERASSLVRASVGFLVSLTLLVVVMTGLAALT